MHDACPTSTYIYEKYDTPTESTCRKQSSGNLRY